MSGKVSTDSEEHPRFDSKALDGVCARDEQALNMFFEHFFDRVFAYTVRLVGNVTLAEDIVQEAFMRMYSAIDRLDSRRDPAPWVFTIVTNTARDYWRSRTHRAQQKHVDIEEAWEHVAEGEHSDPQADYERGERALAVHRAMTKLSPADREILLLKEFEGLSTDEVAKVLQIKPEAIRQRFSRAVRRLGAAYRELVPGNGDRITDKDDGQRTK